ncbi:hypothetical protein [Ligilactobacillus salivarius]|uniref:Uncharacterized protein n=1 Tax=Ligilactobacillus salivarius TaxID=1624 RepID=A0A089QLX2_9LACO|nr:hypothetical protein [Ligilactobacillus salivarius]AIR11861.1 hypothetical protein LSJ_4084 [Ligilactobacillus salivarius]
MNENTKNMVKELQKEFLENWGDISKGLKVTIIDGAKSVFGEYAFDETIIDRVEIAYKGREFEICISDDGSTDQFDLEGIYIEVGIIEDIGKIISIVGKHLNKIELNHYWSAV